MVSGRVEGLTERATQPIQILNLGDHEKNNRKLVEKRKPLVWALLCHQGIDPNEKLEDDDLLHMVAEELLEPNDGKLEAYAPVAANILKHWITDGHR